MRVPVVEKEGLEKSVEVLCKRGSSKDLMCNYVALAEATIGDAEGLFYVFVTFRTQGIYGG